MPVIKLVVSDLHLADGHPILDGFGERQLTALQGLLQSTRPGGPIGDGSEDVELIINGDCFDFLIIPPYETSRIATPTVAVEKLEKIIAAHRPFFHTLHEFLGIPGRHITFITGNHDVELAFEQVRGGIQQAIWEDAQRQDGILFCPTRFYRPLPDVYIEHGHHYDFWNHADLWDEAGNPFSLQPERIPLPLGTQYVQRAAHQISEQYAYFDHFEPSLGSMRQIALFSLLNPPLVIETAQRTTSMMSYPYTPLANLAPGDEQVPVKLFEQAMLDFAAFQADMIARKPEWKVIEDTLRTHPDAPEDGQTADLAEFFELREYLTLPPAQAIRAILAPKVYAMGESVTRGMQNVLRNDSTLRYAIAGHTHILRQDSLHGGAQTYLNTATWTLRQGLPENEAITPELQTWLRQPDNTAAPLRDLTQSVFALITATEGSPSQACLCVWEGGKQGSFRILPQQKE